MLFVLQEPSKGSKWEQSWSREQSLLLEMANTSHLVDQLFLIGSDSRGKCVEKESEAKCRLSGAS